MLYRLPHSSLHFQAITNNFKVIHCLSLPFIIVMKKMSHSINYSLGNWLDARAKWIAIHFYKEDSASINNCSMFYRLFSLIILRVTCIAKSPFMIDVCTLLNIHNRSHPVLWFHPESRRVGRLLPFEETVNPFRYFHFYFFLRVQTR